MVQVAKAARLSGGLPRQRVATASPIAQVPAATKLTWVSGGTSVTRSGSLRESLECGPLVKETDMNMKRLLPFVAAFGLMAPLLAYADSMDSDMRQDRQQMQNTRHDLHNDVRDRNRDLHQGNAGGAMHEQQEINQEQGQLQDERQDLRQERQDRDEDRE